MWGVRDGLWAANRLLPNSGQVLAAADGTDLDAAFSMPDMFLLNSDGVVDDLMTALGGGSDEGLFLQEYRLRSSRKFSGKHLRGHPGLPGNDSSHKTRKSGRCTSVVRLADGNSELYFGHTTNEMYSEMNRMWKVYDFPLQGVVATKISFSSYPGCISSTDDYYLMDSGLAVTETSLDIPLKQNYPSSQSIPDFIRIMVANRLSSSPEDWVQSMIDSATGTYSSQWMVLDYKKFVPHKELPDGAFYVFEQAPSATHYEDMSGHLRKTRYWASFNRAFFDDVRASTGDDAMAEVLARDDDPLAETYSKDDNPRQQIVNHTEGSLNSLAAMRKEMTRNRGTKELLDRSSLQVPGHAISPRNDIVDNEGHINTRGDPFGGVDGKITSSCLFKKLVAQAISSPSHASLPAFRWTYANGTEIWPGYPRKGLPNTANFDWVQVEPHAQMLKPLNDDSRK